MQQMACICAWVQQNGTTFVDDKTTRSFKAQSPAALQRLTPFSFLVSWSKFAECAIHVSASFPTLALKSLKTVHHHVPSLVSELQQLEKLGRTSYSSSLNSLVGACWAIRIGKPVCSFSCIRKTLSDTGSITDPAILYAPAALN